MMDQKKVAILTEISLGLAAVFWGANYAATKYAAEFVPPLLIVALRFTVGGILMYCLLRIVEPADRLKPKDLLPVVGLGCLGVAIGQTAFTFGVSMTSAANTGLIFATAPIWGLLLGLILGLERPAWRGIAGVGLSILGVFIVFFEGIGAWGTSLAGDLFVLLADMAFGSYTVLSMPVLERHSPLTVATYPLLFRGADSPTALFPVPCWLGVGKCWGRGMGGRGLLRGLRHRFLILGLANGRLPHRGQSGLGLPVPDHRHGGCLGHHLLWREPWNREGHRRRGYPPWCVPR
jgi:drug/metabolite transporter (DMT)-like permease